MLRVGLTGGNATGKMTVVVAMLRGHDCRMIEADKIAHRMIERVGEGPNLSIRDDAESVCAFVTELALVSAAARKRLGLIAGK